MKKITQVLFLVLAMSGVATVNAEKLDSLKGINNLALNIIDHSGVLSEVMKNKLKTDIRLKLRSAGVKSRTEVTDTTAGALIIQVNHLPNSGIYSVEMNLIEEATVNRKIAVKMPVRSWTKGAAISNKAQAKDISSIIMNQLVTAFLSRYLDDN